MFINVHPAVVHIPVACLMLYSLFELMHFRRLLAKPYWFYVKATLVIVGAIGAWVARQTGEMIESAFAVGSTAKVVEMHAQWATGTATLFSVIALAYGFGWVQREFVVRWAWPQRFSRFLLRGYVIVPLAALGLVAITVTGALGGSITRGAEADPFVSLVYRLLF